MLGLGGPSAASFGRKGKRQSARGAEVPLRLIQSAKSWLCHGGVDRHAPILPFQSPPDVERVSPIAASSTYLAHLRDAWDASHPDASLAEQTIFLTVPASFDAAARDLTVEAAKRAGLFNLTLLEEPQAAFYAWLASVGDEWRNILKPGDRVLVCDVGGGTTDFSLIEVSDAQGNLQLERVAVGDHILAVNHRPLSAARPFCANLEGRAETAVVLTVNDTPEREGARTVVVIPTGDEEVLRYVDWVRRNREHVAKITDGRMGYVHIPDMGTRGLVAFNTWFFPQLDKEGLVIDCRWNGGGFVSQTIVERLRRSVIGFDRSRGGGVWTYPYRTLNGPFVVLTNERAGSDGDIFPYVCQLEELAPVIGTRSWGGVVGIRSDKDVVDGGMLTQPEYAWWDPKKGWGLENRGVEPDVVCENLPQDLARGIDAQLDKGIEVLLERHKAHPPVQPAFGPPDRKTREAFRDER